MVFQVEFSITVGAVSKRRCIFFCFYSILSSVQSNFSLNKSSVLLFSKFEPSGELLKSFIAAPQQTHKCLLALGSASSTTAEIDGLVFGWSITMYIRRPRTTFASILPVVFSNTSLCLLIRVPHWCLGPN